MTTRVIDDILRREGSTYTDHPADRGGPTKFGITLATLCQIRKDKDLDASDVQDLTEAEARDIYQQIYVKPFQWITDERLRDLTIDSAVQHGVDTAVMLLQKSAATTVDSIIGPETMVAVNSADREDLWRHMFANRLRFYALILQHNPTQRTFAAGWINRMADLCK